MSIHASSIIFLNYDFPNITDKINFSFELQRIANINKIGVNQGGNIQTHTFNEVNYVEKELHGQYVIEIADDPLDFNAEYIFGGYDFDLDVIDDFDKFESRMVRVKSFLLSILEIPIVKKVKILININIGDKYEYICTSISDFEKVIMNSFVKANGWTPSLCIEIIFDNG